MHRTEVEIKVQRLRKEATYRCQNFPVITSMEVSFELTSMPDCFSKPSSVWNRVIIRVGQRGLLFPTFSPHPEVTSDFQMPHHEQVSVALVCRKENDP